MTRRPGRAAVPPSRYPNQSVAASTLGRVRGDVDRARLVPLCRRRAAFPNSLMLTRFKSPRKQRLRSAAFHSAKAPRRRFPFAARGHAIQFPQRSPSRWGRGAAEPVPSLIRLRRCPHHRSTSSGVASCRRNRRGPESRCCRLAGARVASVASAGPFLEVCHDLQPHRVRRETRNRIGRNGNREAGGHRRCVRDSAEESKSLIGVPKPEWPPLADVTVERKDGVNSPLLETGAMREPIAWNSDAPKAMSGAMIPCCATTNSVPTRAALRGAAQTRRVPFSASHC